MVPDFHALLRRNPGIDEPPIVNISDYWDYLDGLAYEAFISERLRIPPPLRRFSVFVTEACDLKCTYCTRSPRTQKRLGAGWLEENIRRARRQGALILDVMGLGEPTLLDDLPDILGFTSGQGMISTIGTHGATRNLETASFRQRLLEASPLKIRVSLDGAEPSSHGISRMSESWRKAVAFVKAAVRTRDQGRARLGIFINRVITSTNVRTLVSDLTFYGELGVDDVHLIPVRQAKELILSLEQLRYFNQQLAPQIEEIGRKQCMGWLAENARLYGSSEDELERASRGVYHISTGARDCYVQRGQLLVDPEYQLYSCLWSRRAGGRPICDVPRSSNIDQIRALALRQPYMKVNPEICARGCTRRVTAVNDCVEDALATLDSPFAHPAASPGSHSAPASCMSDA